MYEQFALQHCKGVMDPPAVCGEIEEAVLDIKHQLQLATKSSVSTCNSISWWIAKDRQSGGITGCVTTNRSIISSQLRV